MTESATDAIKMVDLRVDYGDFAAVDSLSLTIPFGEVYCFRDRAAWPEGQTTPPTDPDERD